jgi:hypothetical protein
MTATATAPATSPATKRAARVAVRVGVAATLAVSGLIHAYLYTDDYQYVPNIGTAFLVQGSIFCALAVLILAGGPAWLGWAGGAASIASLAAFALSRTIGLLGFTEHGWEAPYGPITVIAQVLTVVLVAATALRTRAVSGATR